MDRPDWAPAHVDIERPNAARLYDYYLGGAHNFAVDRELAERALTVLPHGRQMAQQNRAFLRRAVRHLAAAGVRQFLDIGAGIPTRGNTHEVAREVASDARVVYVDFDPVAVAHSQAILAGNSQARVIAEDLRQPEQILAHHDLLGLLDLDQPVAVLMLAVLHFIPDADNPAGVTARYRDALAPGSYLAISHGTDESWPEETKKITGMYQRTATPLTWRNRSQVERLFDGLTIVDPGVVWVTQWHPDHRENGVDHPDHSGIHAGVGRKV
jgi:SAM-dependent methyltransferase